MARKGLALSIAKTLLGVRLIVPVLVPSVAAQGLPAFAPVNPMAASRSGVYFQPYRDPALGGWSVEWAVDYASAIEYNAPDESGPSGSPAYVLDAELLRLGATFTREVGDRGFVSVTLSVRGAYAGFLDGFFDWYHGVLGIELPERERRPQNEFLYRVAPTSATSYESRPGAFFAGDTRLGLGWRWNPVMQSVVSLTLPTSTGPAGYGRGTIAASILQSIRIPVSRRLVYEGSAGFGYTPTHGVLAPFQRTQFVAFSSGVRARLWGRHGVYANLWYHSPYYRETTLPALDRYDMALDLGLVFRTCRGTEWRVGVTEDPKPSGPGIDAVLRLGVAWRTKTAPCARAEIPSSSGRGD